MRINTADGSVAFASGTIGPEMDKSAFLTSPIGVNSERWTANEPYESFRFRPESGITASVEFRDERLLNISILFNLPDDPADGPSTRQELVRKRRHDDWLQSELGASPYRYSWGQVVSNFYQQHCESEITVAYRPND